MKKCPLIGKKCIEHGCMFWTHLVGTNPQTGGAIDEFGCAVTWLPLLLVENADQSRKVAACLDRNNNTFLDALPPHIQQRIYSKQKVQLTQK